jgi:hypothetical protein
MAARTLTDACAVQAPGSRIADGHGGYSSAFATKAGMGAVACRVVSPKAEAIVSVADKIMGRRTLAFQFAAGTDVEAGDQIVYGGINFEVLGVNAPITDEMIRTALAVQQQ